MPPFNLVASMHVNRNSFVLCSLVAALMGCTPTDTTSEIAQTVDVRPMPMDISSVEPELIAGRYTWDHEVDTLQPCGSTDTLWVTGEPKVLASLHERAQSLAARATGGFQHRPLYVELRGALSDRPDEGFGAHFDGVLYVDEVELVESEIPKTCTDTNTYAP